MKAPSPARLLAERCRWIRNAPSLTSSERLVLYTLVGFDGVHGCWPSVPRVAACTGLGASTVRRTLRALEDRHMLIIREPRLGRSSVYRFCFAYPNHDDRPSHHDRGHPARSDRPPRSMREETPPAVTAISSQVSDLENGNTSRVPTGTSARRAPGDPLGSVEHLDQPRANGNDLSKKPGARLMRISAAGGRST